MRELRRTTRIAAPVEDCFDLALSVDAHTSSTGASEERAVAGVTSGQLEEGDVVTWRARHFGLPFRMTVRITSYDRPGSFVDEQVRGPFGSWRHEHRFEAVDDGTIMTDLVSYRSPLGPVGRVVDAVVLERYMLRLLEQRNRWLALTLEERRD